MKPAIAVLVDGDQLGPETMPALMERLEQTWTVTERICSRNWRSTRDQQAWREFSADHSFRCIQRDPVATGKNAADIELTVTAMDLMHGLGYRNFCLVSGDMDFTPLVERLRRGGCTVEWVRPEDLPPAGGARSRAARSRRGARTASPPPAKPAPATKQAPPTKAAQAAKQAPPPEQAKSAPTARQAQAAKPTPAARQAQAAKPAPAAAQVKQAPAPSKPAATTRGDHAAFAKAVRRGIETLRRRGEHERGWVSVNRLGSVLTEQGDRKEDFGFAKRRSLREVLEDVGFRVEQLETGAYRVTLDEGKR